MCRSITQTTCARENSIVFFCCFHSNRYWERNRKILLIDDDVLYYDKKGTRRFGTFLYKGSVLVQDLIGGSFWYMTKGSFWYRI